MKTNIALVKIQDVGEEIHYSYLVPKMSKICISFTLLVPGAIITTFQRSVRKSLGEFLLLLLIPCQKVHLFP